MKCFSFLGSQDVTDINCQDVAMNVSSVPRADEDLNVVLMADSDRISANQVQ